MVGSSETFGSRLAEADTIPALLQTALHRAGRDRISVYNFGIEGANIGRDLALVRHFKDIYGIDQVVFIVGGAETWGAYSDVERPDLVTFELHKTARWLMATWFEPSPARIAQFDAQYQALSPDKKSRLVDGIKAANDYCRSASFGATSSCNRNSEAADRLSGQRPSWRKPPGGYVPAAKPSLHKCIAMR